MLQVHLLPKGNCLKVSKLVFQYLFFYAAVGSPLQTHCINVFVGGARLLLFKNNLGDGERTFQMFLWPILMAL